MSAQVTQAPASQLYLSKARDASNAEDCMAIYDQWAATYNTEVGDEAQNYVAPVSVAQAALKYSKKAERSVILDAGCGTGLVGQALAIGGAKIIDGIDLSVPMLKIAEQTGVYRELSPADMNRPLDQTSNTYDVVTCVGTFTRGHVGPDPGLKELIRVTKSQGVIVATILEEIWISGGFKTEVEKLAEKSLVRVVSDELVDYVKGHGDKAVLLVLEKIELAN